MTPWQEVAFGELASSERAAFSMGPFGSKVTKDNYVAEGVPVIRGGNLARGIFIDSDFVFITHEKADELMSANARPGDLIFTHRGTIGQVSMIPRQPAFSRYVIGSSQVKCRLDESVAVPEFYYYWFRSPRGRSSILANVSTVGVPGIATPLSTVRGLKVPLPSLDEQRGIAEVLGALDGKIVHNERVAHAALDLAESLYLRDSSVSEGWRDRLLKDTSIWLSGGTPRTSETRYWGGDIPWISAASLKSPWLHDSDRSVTVLGAQNGTRLVPKGAIIFVVRGMSLTSEFRIGIAQREVAFGQDCKALIPNPGVESHVLFLAIKANARKILDMVDLAGHGTGRLVTQRVENLQVRLPEGTAAEKFVACAGTLLEQAAAATKENRTLAELRDTLLPQLLSGKIRVKDAVRTVEEAV